MKLKKRPGIMIELHPETLLQQLHIVLTAVTTVRIDKSAE
jgi:hypothetical protein